MAIRMQVQGLDKLKRKSGRLERDVKGAVVDQIHKEAREFGIEMRTRAMAYGKLPSIAAGSLRVVLDRDGGSIAGGGRGGLARTLFRGSEFGGRRKRKTYVSHIGPKYFVIERRRTTMMFLPFLGRRGYFYLPTLRSGLKGQHLRMRDAAVRGVNE